MATAAGVAGSGGGGFEFLRCVDADGFDGDLLEGELVFGLVEEAEREGVGLVAGAELDFDRLADELGECLGHFAVEDEGGVGVEFFLKLEDVRFVAGPGARLIHREHECVAAFVVGEGVEDGWVFEAHRAAGSGGGGFGAQSGWFSRQNLQNSQNFWNEIL